VTIEKSSACPAGIIIAEEAEDRREWFTLSDEVGTIVAIGGRTAVRKKAESAGFIPADANASVRAIPLG
jgi:hypothetical protein